MIARAAEGSMRDAQSIFDQSIAHGAGTVTAEAVRAMLGLADRARIIDLFENLMKGEVGRRARRVSGAVRHRRRPGDGAYRPGRIQPSGDQAAFRAVGCRRCVAVGG